MLGIISKEEFKRRKSKLEQNRNKKMKNEEFFKSNLSKDTSWLLGLTYKGSYHYYKLDEEVVLQLQVLMILLSGVSHMGRTIEIEDITFENEQLEIIESVKLILNAIASEEIREEAKSLAYDSRISMRNNIIECIRITGKNTVLWIEPYFNEEVLKLGGK